MTLYVLGGSNSRRHDGWVRHLEERHKGNLENLSIGATTSLTAVYRMLLDPFITGPGVVVWEYALNEVNHIKGGYDCEGVLRIVEHMIRICRERNLRFVPVIFTPQQEEAAQHRHPYFDKLCKLFDHYGLQ